MSGTLELPGTTAINGTGDGAANRITGSNGVNTRSGLNGNDRRMGGKGNDPLIAGNGADVLDGGLGQDRLTGGTDAAGDDFRFGTTVESARGTLRDAIYNFSTGVEDIDLKAIDAKAGAAESNDTFLWANKAAACLFGVEAERGHRHQRVRGRHVRPGRRVPGLRWEHHVDRVRRLPSLIAEDRNR